MPLGGDFDGQARALRETLWNGVTLLDAAARLRLPRVREFSKRAWHIVGTENFPQLFGVAHKVLRYRRMREIQRTPLWHALLKPLFEDETAEGLFQPGWYRRRSGPLHDLHPFRHFLNEGAAAGLDPNPLFSTTWYLKRYPRVARKGVNPLIHYVTTGERLGFNPHPLFDARWYLEQNADINRGGNGLAHFLALGARLRRSPHPLFDTAWYLKTYPRLADRGVNPLIHFLTVGAADGCLPHPEFEASWYESPSLEAFGITENPYYVLRQLQAIGAAAAIPSVGSIEVAAPANVTVPERLADYVCEHFGPDALEDVISTFPLLAKTAAAPAPGQIVCSAFAKAAARLREEAARRGQSAFIDVSIIVPVHNQIGHTLGCLLSVLRHKTRYGFEVIVGDDASSDGTAQLIGSIGGPVVHLRHEENLGFLRNCNACAQRARGRHLVLLNNDTLVLPRWLDTLVDRLEADPKVGLVGSKLISADGRLQEAGGIVWRDGSAANFGRGEDPDLPAFNYLKEVDYCSGASIAVRGAAWRELGGFDEAFLPAYYEDPDLAFRLRQAGYRVLYQPESVVIHHEGASHGRDVTQGIKRHQVENARIFVGRWQSVLERENFPPGEDIFLARDRSRGRPRMLVLDHWLPKPDRDAGSRSLSRFVHLFAAHGLQLTYWPDELRYEGRYVRDLQQRGIEVYYGSTFVRQFGKWLAKHGHHFSYVFLSRPDIAHRFMKIVRKHTKAKILYNGVDIHFMRLAEQVKLEGNGDAKSKMQKYWRIEPAAWKAADLVYYFSPEEVRVVDETVGRGKARLVPIFTVSSHTIAESERALDSDDFAARRGLLFVGGFQHSPNADGVAWFVREIWPQLLQRCEGITLSVVGGAPPPQILDLASERIRIMGYVDSPTLARLYRETRIAIVPLRYGAGIKGKLIEAVSMGTPVVSTPVGVQGLDEMRSFVTVAEGAAAFADALADLYGDLPRRAAVAREGLAFLRANYSEQAVLDRFAEDIPELRIT